MGSCSMMSCSSTSSPCWPWSWSAWWQCSLCLPAAPASTSRPSPSSQTQRKQTLLRHLSHNGGRVNIGKRGLNVGAKQKIWPISNFLTTLLHDVSTSTWLYNTAQGLLHSSRRWTFQDKYFSWLYLFWFPVLERKEKVPRQLVALCLVRGLVHNTCVFLPDQADVSRCKAMAGDVVLHLIKSLMFSWKAYNFLTMHLDQKLATYRSNCDVWFSKICF